MIFRDLRFAVRTLLNSPGYALIAMLSLALGIGANSTVFSLADALLLRPLPVAEPGEVVNIRGITPSAPFAGVSYPDYRDIRDNARSFEAVFAFQMVNTGFAESPDALPQLKAGFAVSGNFFDALQLQPQAGRFFTPEEDRVPGRDAVLVLSHDLWQKTLHADPNILGRRLRLNGVEFTVIGIAPEAFTGLDTLVRPAFYLPLHMTPSILSSKFLEDRGARRLGLKGRLRDGVGIRQAEAELSALTTSLARTYPATNRNFSLAVRTELQERIEQSPPDAMIVAILMSLVLLVLLIACANVTNLMLSRARARSREMAVRLALGANRYQLIRQLFLESLVIAVAGAALGLMVAYGGVAMLSRIQIPTDLPIELSIRLDQRVLLFTLLVAVAGALLSGLAPAFQTTGTELTTAIKAGDQALAERRRLFGRNALVVMQVAFSLVLLVCASMMVRGVETMLRSNPGFRTTQILFMTFDPALVRYSQTQTTEYYKRLVEVARQAPGVRSVALASTVPMWQQRTGFEVIPEGYQFPKDEDRLQITGASVDENYFQTFGVKLLKGRPFAVTDSAGAPGVAIVNAEFAKRYYGGLDAIGRRLKIPGSDKWFQVVGITETTPSIWIAEPPTPCIYFPYAQQPRTRMTLIALGSDSAALVQPLREAIRSLDPNQPVYNIRTVESFYQMRVVAVVSTIRDVFAAAGLIGLALSMVGLYGLVSYAVSRRTREIGIRMAIGADRRSVLAMVLRQGLALSGGGIALGLVGAGAAAQVLAAAFQFPIEPYVLAGVSLGLAAVTVLATLAPARRASRVDPIRALRWE